MDTDWSEAVTADSSAETGRNANSLTATSNFKLRASGLRKTSRAANFDPTAQEFSTEGSIVSPDWDVLSNCLM